MSFRLLFHKKKKHRNKNLLLQKKKTVGFDGTPSAVKSRKFIELGRFGKKDINPVQKPTLRDHEPSINTP